MFIIDQCCEEIDFFSIGSNDLTQYLLAVDRDNAKVTRHDNSLNPASWRSITPCRRCIARQMDWSLRELGSERFRAAVADWFRWISSA